MKRMLALILVALLAGRAVADAKLDALGTQLTLPRRVFGGGVEPWELRGRVVIFWDITGFVSAMAGRGESSSSNSKVDKANSPVEQMRDEHRRLRSAAKGASKDGRLLVVAVTRLPEDSEQRKQKVEAIRRLRPPYPVYDIATSSALFDAQGNLVMEAAFKDVAESDRLTNALKEAPEYLPGRIILFRTEGHEGVSKSFVAGKNIERPLGALRREAGGQGPKAEEARRMVEAVDAWITQVCAAIEGDLQTAPSQAIAQIQMLQRTLPSRARKYQGALGGLMRDQGVKQLRQVRAFLDQTSMGKVGRGDMANAADDFTAKLTALSQAKGVNPAVASEAGLLISLLQPLTSEAQAKELQAAKAQRTERRKQAAAAEQAAKKASKNAAKKEGGADKPRVARLTPYLKLQKLKLLTPACETIQAELSSEYDDLCNYEALRGKLSKLASSKSPKAEGAQAAIAAIESYRKQVELDMSAILKEQRLLDVFLEETDWRQLLTVNFPSLQPTTMGTQMMKVVNDQEVRSIAENVTDYRQPRGFADLETAEAGTVATIQYRQARLRALQKYRKSTSAFGRACAVHLDKLGFTDAELTKLLNELEESLREAKRAQKDADKRKKESDRQNNRD